MTRYGSVSPLWPSGPSGRKRLLGPVSVGQAGVGVAIALIAAVSFSDMVLWPSAEGAATVASVPTASDATASPPAAAGTGLCWQDWPNFVRGCGDGHPESSSKAAVPDAAPVREPAAPATANVLAAPAEAPSSSGSQPSTVAATDGARPAATGLPAQGASPPAVDKLSERELTFKHGYAQRRAALATSGAVAPTDSTASKAPPTKLVQAKHKRRKDQVVVQVYEMADGRRVVVRRHSGGSQTYPPIGGPGFRSAEIGQDRSGQRSGEPFGMRSGWFAFGSGRGL
jgi:hypothetical protein